jgi:hypothetical protein
MNRPTLRQVLAAIAERDEVERLNEPTRRLNAEIREHNADLVRGLFLKHPKRDPKKLRELASLLPEWRQRVPYEHRISDSSVRVMDAEERNNRDLVAVPPILWQMRVESLPENVRVPVACIIWWDFFGPNEGESWPHLDKYVNARYHDASDADLIAALEACGYSQWKAWRRIMWEQQEQQLPAMAG